MICNKCNYKWNSRLKEPYRPKECPRCKTRLDIERLKESVKNAI